MFVQGLPTLEWTNGVSGVLLDPSTGMLTLHCAGGVDWSNDALGGPHQHGASMLGFAPRGDFSLHARARVVGERTTFDAAALGLWIDEEHWAKLCFEFSPQGQAMVVSVVTNGYSDDSNAVPVDEEFVHLRIARIGQAYAFHSSSDGRQWDFVRLFRLDSGTDPRVGFLAQAPLGEGIEARFDQIELRDSAPLDLRDGS